MIAGPAGPSPLGGAGRQPQEGDDRSLDPRGPDAGPRSPAAELRRAVSVFADHVENVVADAERASEAIRREAESDAARRLAQSRHEAEHLVAERTAELNRILNDLRSIVRVRLARIERESEEMLRAIEDAILGPRQADSEPRTNRPGPASTAYPGTGVSPTQAPAGSESESTRRSPADRDAVDRALLRAAQMAGSGAAASEVEDALRQDVGGEQARAIVDQVFDD